MFGRAFWMEEGFLLWDVSLLRSSKRACVIAFATKVSLLRSFEEGVLLNMKMSGLRR